MGWRALAGRVQSLNNVRPELDAKEKTVFSSDSKLAAAALQTGMNLKNARRTRLQGSSACATSPTAAGLFRTLDRRRQMITELALLEPNYTILAGNGAAQ
jgi:hypothetical protein